MRGDDTLSLPCPCPAPPPIFPIGIQLRQPKFPFLPPSRGSRLSAHLVPFKTFCLLHCGPRSSLSRNSPLYPPFRASAAYRKPNPPESSLMSLLRRVDIMDRFFCPPSSFVAETSVFAPRALTFPPFLDEPEDICLALDLLSPSPTRLDLFDAVEDLVQIERTPRFSSYRKVIQRVRPESYYLQSLCDRVSALESRFDRLVDARGAASDRRYTWTAEIEGKEADRKYKWTAEIKAGKKEKKEKHHHLHHHLLRHHGGARSYKWTAEIKEKGEEGYTRTYKWRSSTGGGDDGEAKSHKDKKDKKEKKKEDKFATRVVEIEEPSGHGTVVLREVRRVIFKLSLQLPTIKQI